MRAFAALLIATATVLFVVGCASSWPTDLPPEHYTGTIINASVGRPEAGAVVEAKRPGGRGLGIWSDETLAQTVSDAQGRFVLRTRSGYATTLFASSHDARLAGSSGFRGRSADDIIISIKPTLAFIMCQRGVDPESARVHQASAVVLRLVSYLSAHPQEPLHSLRTYQKLGVISPEDLAGFTVEPNLFFGSNAEVQYGWGKQAFVFPTVDAPITFGTPSFPFGPKFGAAKSGKAH